MLEKIWENGGDFMDKDKWARISFDAQPYIDALCGIAKREGLDMMSICVKGIRGEDFEPKSLRSSVFLHRRRSRR